MTRLTALELFGFKSFADRTRFEFPDGITVVVGPNGSGKSNVVDAIKWVLGEQSVRSLRGKEMTDVIFAGSAARKPLNMAEVSLCFDNSARDLPVQADAVQISRRVYRNGESEYLVNGEPTRLRDIRELFSGTGAATEAYSVIEQGRVDALLVASGRDRRAVFEEAAGITRFRSRRAEALRRLERAEQNRQRLADIVGEVSSPLDTVRNQAGRARRWKMMQDRLRRFRIAAAARDLGGVDADIAGLEEAIASARSAADASAARAGDLARAAGLLAAESDELLPRVQAARDQAAADSQRLAAAVATETLVRGRRDEFATDLDDASAAVATAGDAERAAAAAVSRAESTAATIAADLESIRERLATRESAAAGAQGDDDAAREHLEAARSREADLGRRHLRLESVLERAETVAADAHAAADAAGIRVADARGRQATIGETREACLGHLQAVEARLAAAGAEVEALEAAQREETAALQAAWKDRAGWQAALEACRERHDVLEGLIDRREGLSEAARMLLEDRASSGVPGTSGVLADLVVAGVEWASLVDLALGELGQSIVVDSVDEAIGWHTRWSATPEAARILAAGGRIGFLAAASLGDPDGFEVADAIGVVGRLDRLVAASRTDAAVPDLVRRLLGRVWVVERIEHALPLLATAPAGTLFLTRDGASLRADGGFAVGSPAGSAGLVARRSELRALEERREELARIVTRTTGQVDAAQAAIDARTTDIATAGRRRQEIAEAVATGRGEISRLDRDAKAAAEALVALEAEVRRLDQRAVAADADRESVRRDLDEADRVLTAAREAVARRRAAIDDAERDRGAVLAEVQALRINEAATVERLGRSRDAVASTTATHAAARLELDAARDQLAAARRRIAGHELELLAATAARAEAAWVAEQAATRLAEVLGDAARTDAARQGVSADVEATRAEGAALADRLHTLELEVGEARHRRARIVERIRDEYDIAIDAEIATEPAPALPAADADEEPIPADRAELETRIEELRRKLGAMGSVNLEALREAEELAARLATLEAQLADVTGGKESIEQLISRIDDESRRLLAETIETVRGHFRDLFERVFGGGQADIVLEEGVDLLEAAVEIVARPPGKEPRSISLLSGGEKTMTCVALLLAIFKSRPSPFCVLDEVDAALDEANVDRFVGVLRDFLSSTQFIVVTHSKKTMASATTLYGVTMEESGVSKRVSVRFESTAAAARAA
ncbi:MAG: chromosome segregation protein SMC [Planctomycetaceae bacterium]